MQRTIRPILLLTAAVLAAGLFRSPTTAAAQADAGRRPNILLIISDDFGMDVTSDMYPGLIDGLSARYGPSGLNHPRHGAIAGRPASTPRLEELAREGMVFQHAWANPFCSPTRASLLTGLFAGRNKVLTYADPLSQSHTSFVRTLRYEGGYSTAVFGKWHMAGLPGREADYPGMKPKEAGFDLFKGNMHAAIRSYWDYDYQIQDEATPSGEWRTETPPVKSLPGIAPTTYGPVVKAADAVEWITAREQADPDRPWFVWLAFNLSHTTIQAQPSAMAVPNADTLDEVSRREMEACGGRFGSNEPGRCSGEALMRAMTNSMDTVIGKVVDAVDALDPNTYVIFVGDNGTPMYGRPNLDFIDNLYITRTARGKGTAYESGAHVPLAIRGPGIAPDSASTDYVHVVDLFATSLALAGLPVPDVVSNSDGTGTLPLDGVSLAPILSGAASRVRDPDRGYVLTETVNLMTNSTRTVGARNATHKVVCVNGVEACEFFDLRDDPLEEYPLKAPDRCPAGAEASGIGARDDAWHYCRLMEIVRTQSFF